MKRKKLSDFWEKMPQKGDKHFTECLSDEKIRRMKQRVNDNLFNHIDFSIVNNSLDWGCGGGLFTKDLMVLSEVAVVDISAESISHTKEYVSKNLFSQIIPDNLDSFEYEGPNIDLLFCHTVIHHFPSVEYWIQVFNIWIEQINPIFFAVQIKVDSTTKNFSDEDYFRDDNYLNGLYFNEDEFLSYFINSGYECINKVIEKNYYKNPDKTMNVGYYILRKNK